MTRALIRSITATCIALMTGTAAAQTASGDFDTRLPLRISGDGLHVIEFPEVIYHAARSPDLADVRIFNAREEMLPIAFVPLPAPAWSTAAAIQLRIAALPAEVEARDSLLRTYALRIERDRARALIEFEPTPARPPTPAVGGYLIDARGLKGLQGRLALTFATGAPDYAGHIEVLGSDDLVSWRRLTSGPLTQTRSLGEVVLRNSFELVRPPSFLRVAWTSSAVPVIDAAQFVEHVAPVSVLPRATLATALGEDRRTLYVDVPEALPVTRLFVRVPELNRIVRAQVYRHVDAPRPRSRRSALGPRRPAESWHPVGSIEAFRVLREGVEVEGPPLTYVGRTDQLRFDLPMPLEGDLVIEAEYRPMRAVFAARGPGPYVLAVGHPEARSGPTLNPSAILAADDPSGLRLPIATVDVAANESSRDVQVSQRFERSARWSRYVLWTVLALGVIGLTWMAWRLLLQLRAMPRTKQDPTATTLSDTSAEIKRPAE